MVSLHRAVVFLVATMLFCIIGDGGNAAAKSEVGVDSAGQPTVVVSNGVGGDKTLRGFYVTVRKNLERQAMLSQLLALEPAGTINLTAHVADLWHIQQQQQVGILHGCLTHFVFIGCQCKVGAKLLLER